MYIPPYDANGNVTGYIDQGGNVVAQYTYDAFGNMLASAGTMADGFRIRFLTKYRDKDESGFYYYGYRYYSPSLSRWLTRDPLEEEGGVNLYAFCANNPVVYFDAFGEDYNLFDLLSDAWCDDAYRFGLRHLYTEEGKRAWTRYANHGWRGRDRDIYLTPEEVRQLPKRCRRCLAE